MKIRTTYKSRPNITAGKVYEGMNVVKRNGFALLDIKDDDGDVISVNVGWPCLRLDSIGRWEVVEI